MQRLNRVDTGSCKESAMQAKPLIPRKNSGRFANHPCRGACTRRVHVSGIVMDTHPDGAVRATCAAGFLDGLGNGAFARPP